MQLAARLPALRPTWNTCVKFDTCALNETGRHPPEATDEQELYQFVAREGVGLGWHPSRGSGPP
jgi:hypothetical protein